FLIQLPPISTLFPYTTLFRSTDRCGRTPPVPYLPPRHDFADRHWRRQMPPRGTAAPVSRMPSCRPPEPLSPVLRPLPPGAFEPLDRKSTRLNSSHSQISYAVF